MVYKYPAAGSPLLCMDARLQVGKEGKGSIGLPGARSWVPGRGLSCRLLCLLLAGGVWVVQSLDGFHLFTSLSTFGPPAPPELSPVTGLNRCLVAVLQRRECQRGKAPQVGGRCPGSASPLPSSLAGSAPAPAQTHTAALPHPDWAFAPLMSLLPLGQAGLFYLLPAGTAFLALSLLASPLCKAMRGHKVGPQHCWPRPGHRKCGRGGALAISPEHIVAHLKVQVRRLGT